MPKGGTCGHKGVGEGCGWGVPGGVASVFFRGPARSYLRCRSWSRPRRRMDAACACLPQSGKLISVFAWRSSSDCLISLCLSPGHFQMQDPWRILLLITVCMMHLQMVTGAIFPRFLETLIN